MNSIAILWAQYGPYHLARVAALRKQAAPAPVYALELADGSRDYAWTRPAPVPDLVTLFPGLPAEQLSLPSVFWRVRAKLKQLNPSVCLLPSYAPKPSLAALLAAKSLRLRTVMMNESHAGTARANGPAALLKRWLINWFDAALVGGEPHRRYFAAMGLPHDKIFTGYDAVDNDAFARAADAARSDAPALRRHHALPERYFLSLGRLVPKKNLPALVHAYRLFLDALEPQPCDLVIVGSGQEEASLKALCADLGLPVYEHPQGAAPAPPRAHPALTAGVHLYGFRQVQESPVFYGLANAFILPSQVEEWGLVVNEAMASGLPVVVSQTAGCAEDLLPVDRDPPGSADAALNSKRRRNGFVFDPGSPAELASILLALNASPALRSSMGSASRAIIKRFSCENFGRSSLSAARAALGAQPSAPLPIAALGRVLKN